MSYGIHWGKVVMVTAILGATGAGVVYGRRWWMRRKAAAIPLPGAAAAAASNRMPVNRTGGVMYEGPRATTQITPIDTGKGQSTPTRSKVDRAIKNSDAIRKALPPKSGVADQRVLGQDSRNLVMTLQQSGVAGSNLMNLAQLKADQSAVIAATKAAQQLQVAEQTGRLAQTAVTNIGKRMGF